MVLALIPVAGIVAAAGWLAVTRPAAAKAPLAERDPVIVAFTNTTGDPVFDGTLRLALAIHLEQSPYLRLTPERTMQETLRFLGQPATAAVTPDVALQVCERVGASAVLHGSIAPMGQRYVVGLEAIACVSHDTVARAQAEAAGREQVLEALTRAANTLRRNLGESFSSIARFDVPLVQATTPSLEALRAVSVGDREQFRGAYLEALQHYRQATVIDPDFALAWARAGVTLLNLRRRGEAQVPLTRAFDLRERVSEPERLYIAGHYYNGVLESPLRAIDAFSALSRSTARATPARINLSAIYQQIGLWEQAIEEAQTAVALEPDNVVAHVVLAGAFTGAGRFDEALAALVAAERRGLQSPSTHDLRHDLGFLRDDGAVIREEEAYAMVEPSMAPFLLTRRARMAMYRGRFREATDLWSRIRADAEGRQDDVAASAALLTEAGSRALIGDRAGTSRALAAGLAIDRSPSRVAQSALVLALAGDVTGAQRYLAEYARLVAPGSDRDLEFVVPARAALAVAEGRFADAGPLLESIRPYELGTRFEYLPVFIRAHAALGMQAYGEAAQAFQAILDNRGVLPYSVFHPLAWLGRARAYAGLGQTAESLRSYDMALTIWNDADPDLPLLASARREAAALRRNR
jgi:tetratricopeptide (TPR) repeat protein